MLLLLLEADSLRSSGISRRVSPVHGGALRGDDASDPLLGRAAQMIGVLRRVITDRRGGSVAQMI